MLVYTDRLTYTHIYACIYTNNIYIFLCEYK